jgi:hypothetical protein
MSIGLAPLDGKAARTQQLRSNARAVAGDKRERKRVQRGVKEKKRKGEWGRWMWRGESQAGPAAGGSGMAPVSRSSLATPFASRPVALSQGRRLRVASCIVAKGEQSEAARGTM